jgi:hypothetical protein
VRKRPTWPQRIFCPVSVPARSKPCPAASSTRKPLSMWRKSGLSTVLAPFTITTNLYIYLIFLKQLSCFARINRRWRPQARPTPASELVCQQKGRDASLPQGTANAAAAHPFFCLQESGRIDVAKRTPEPERQQPCCKVPLAARTCFSCKTSKFSQQTAPKTASLVEKRLHIHSGKCAEARFFPA